MGSQTKLAIDGGVPVRSRPLAPWPCFDPDEVEAVSRLLRSGRVNYWTGSEGRDFEREYAAFCRADFGVALANGTVALELALYAIGVGPGDEVVVPSRTFMATASAVVMRGAVPIFADVDQDSQNITADTVERVLTRRAKAVIAVHLAGWPCDMDPLRGLCQERSLTIIEDCAQAHGATYRGQPVGSLGRVGAFSFCQDKIITTGGEGGMLVTSDQTLWRRSWSFKDHGKDPGKSHHTSATSSFRWLHDSIGTNWRMTEMQAAIGRLQLNKVRQWIDARRGHAALLTERFSKIDALRLTEPPPHVGHSYYKYYVFIRPEALKHGWTRDRIICAVQAEGIPCQSGICGEVYRERAFDGSPSRPSEPLPVAKELHETSLMLQVHPTLNVDEIDDTAAAVEKVLAAAVR